MIRRVVSVSCLAGLVFLAGCVFENEVTGTNTGPPPPFITTTEIDPDIITDQDPTAYTGLTANGQGTRMMFDRRVGDSITVNAYLFAATYDDGLTLEVEVNPEFGDAMSAQVEAEKYAEALGRVPTALRTDVDKIWIHDGFQLFGSGSDFLLVYAGLGELHRIDGYLEEALAHEAVHTSLDGVYLESAGWLAAQGADNWFISRLARDFPALEDLAESFIPYLAARHRANRITPTVESLINQTITNRMDFLDGLGLDLHPIQ